MKKHGLFPEESTVLPKKERSKDPRFDRLKTIMRNPKKVSLEDVEIGEIKSFPSIYMAGKFMLCTGMGELGRINIRLTFNNIL